MAETSLYICLISFHSRDVPCTLSRLFVRPDFLFFCARLAVHYLAVYSALGSLIKQSLTATATSTACVIILCSLLHRCLQKVTLKKQREIAKFGIYERR